MIEVIAVGPRKESAGAAGAQPVNVELPSRFPRRRGAQRPISVSALRRGSGETWMMP